MRPLRILTFTSLFPSDARPRHGIFVENRLAHLVRDCAVEARVIAPVPWFPFRAAVFGAYAHFAATPRRAIRGNGLQVAYPRYVMVPKIGVGVQPDSMALAARWIATRWIDAGWVPDLIDAHYLYPDGVAADLLARHLRLPFVMTARGTDVNILAHMPRPGRRIAEAAARAASVITVSRSLKEQLIGIGVDAAKITVLRNGVDLDVFGMSDRAQSRAELGMQVDGQLVACVGNLVPEKGQALAIEALQHAPELRVAIVGDGPLRAQLAQLAERLGVADRVDFKTAMPQKDLHRLYSAADVLLLTSSREGWPNVVLEAMACGTPVVGFDVGAAAEMVTSDSVGRLLVGGDPAELAAVVRQVIDARLDRHLIRAHAATFDWKSVSHAQWDLFVRASGLVEPELIAAH
jgi:teichuronic acid biosynthesis glycosyltransferase TuaC